MNLRHKSELVTSDKVFIRRERLKSMRLSTLEGSFAVVMVAIIEAFYVPYLHAMGASALEIGLAVGLPALAASLVQAYSLTSLKKAGSRKKLITITALVQAICFIPFALMCYVHGNWGIWGAIVFFLLLSTAGNLGAAPWADWMGHIVPKRRHGKYFANRNRILGLIQLAIAIIASFLLDHSAGKVMMMFSLIWFSCFAARTISGLLFIWMYEPPAAIEEPKQAGGFLDFIKSLPRTNFGTFTLATSLLNLAVNFSAPFFAVHMLMNLKLSYVGYTVLTVTATAAIVGSIGLWGRIIDRFGAITAMRFCTLGITLLPLPWVVTENYWILMGVQIFSGFCWSGFNLGFFVYYLNFQGNIPRITSISYFNTINFFCIFAGATLGGLLGPCLPTIAKYQLQTIFVASVLMRIVPAILFQCVKIEKHPQKFTPIERLFFDPDLNIHLGIARSVLRLFKRNI